MNASTHPLVAVVWDDAKATAVVEYDLNEVRTQFHRPARYTTYGLMLVDDEAGITLAAEEGDDRNLRGLSFIPRPMIVEVVTITRPRVRKARARKPAAEPAAAPVAEPPPARQPEAALERQTPEVPAPPSAAPATPVAPEAPGADAGPASDPAAG